MLSREIKTLVKTTHDVTQDSLRVMLTIKADHRAPSQQVALGEKEMEQIAEDLVKNLEDGDDYVILTKTGKKITPKEIFVRTTVSIPAIGKTVDRDKAWSELLLFHKRLLSTGVF